MGNLTKFFMKAKRFFFFDPKENSEIGMNFIQILIFLAQW